MGLPISPFGVFGGGTEDVGEASPDPPLYRWGTPRDSIVKRPGQPKLVDVLVPARRDCEVFYRKFHFALIERFPDIKPTVARRNDSRKPLCESLAEGKASLTAVWEDPKSEASMTAAMSQPGK